MQCGGDDGIMVVNARADNTQQFYQQLVRLMKTWYVAAVKSRASANSITILLVSLCVHFFLFLAEKWSYHHYGDTAKLLLGII